ncbi:hypothetical protein MettiDRAFT_2351 [Methanolobus tindarius DSM 2278]|uniref:CopG family transcriptional regulator n=1 Tax=Methanolobus tindarius DSM 2278 TaxID=1090322 RepID=W9DQK9_METTI|nr:hypothetical protein MettiDRAFT_2351 [Methanolobus tindarius DSM 2278]
MIRRHNRTFTIDIVLDDKINDIKGNHSRSDVVNKALAHYFESIYNEEKVNNN